MLDEPTLVLNRSWRIIHVTTVKKALTLVYEGAARVVNPETYETYDFYMWVIQETAKSEPCIRSMCFRIKIPEVIVLTYYDGSPPKSVHFSRHNIYQRDNFTCQYCNTQPGVYNLTVDHVIPRSRGGRSDWLNCVSACSRCNRKKGNHTLEEVHMKLLRKPFRPEGNNALFFSLNALKKSWENFIASETGRKPIQFMQVALSP
jgi:5-methylcytosine-specific restriction endonuclease McrA